MDTNIQKNNQDDPFNQSTSKYFSSYYNNYIPSFFALQIALTGHVQNVPQIFTRRVSINDFLLLNHVDSTKNGQYFVCVFVLMFRMSKMNNFIDDPLKLYIKLKNIFSIDLCKMILKYSSMGVHNAQKTFYLKSFFCNLQNAKILHHRIFKYLHSIEHPLQPPSNFNFINSSIFV